MCTGITHEAATEFVTELVKVSLWLADWLERQEGVPLEETLSFRTDIYRLTTLWDGEHHPAHQSTDWHDEKWNQLLTDLRAIRAKHGDDTDAFEAAGLALLWPVLEPRIEAYARTAPRPEDRPFGFFSYDLDDEPDTIAIHMGNPFAPQSPFRDMDARARELLALLDHAQATYPAAQHVWTGTWMNSYPPFRKLFPEAWHRSASDPTPLDCWGNWWGQMVSRTGGFHHKNGEHLRRTGRFPYDCVRCSCRIVELREHLQRMAAKDNTHRP